jgi:preprotein translocase subunit SecA
MGLLDKIFGNANNRMVEKMQLKVAEIGALEPQTKKLSDEEIRLKTEEFKDQLKKGKKIDDLLPEAFALVREAANRAIGQRAFDVQLIGAMVLHQGKIAEMKTGEGKTLAAVFAVYLNALSGKGAHVVTVNDYLSKRDANWMGAIYHFLGLSTACILHDSSFLYQPKIVDGNEVTVEMENLIPVSRREAYAADVTYGTNNEFGFDYLRDNMAQSLEQMVQRPLHYAIVDEVDSILIDEARTPLIISAPDSESTKMYEQFARIVPRLKENEDYELEEKTKSVTLTAEGINKMEKWLGIGNIYETSKIHYVHHLEQALKAQIVFKLDRDYVVKDGEVIIVDDFTGRLMPGRRYSEGLHQAIEAKEGVKVQRESRTLATITFQNYFRMYEKLAGMTGTAMTNAEEFHKVYKLDVVEVPTNVAMVRKDLSDIIYKTEKGKLEAITNEIRNFHKEGRPVLVGTVAIEKSELLSEFLKKSGIEHEVLNAKNHEREAQIISKAGQKGAVTIATNMAGRGTDIKLGEGIKEIGGLHIIGTERHEARRIDNQLRGRAGRQGDPGSSQFFVSLEDELMRRFGGDRLKDLMNRLGLPDDQPIENKMISRSIESAQGKIEGYNFDIRKHVLEYDDVMNKQREVIYKKRKNLLEKENIKNEIDQMYDEEIESIVGAHTAFEDEDSWNNAEIIKEMELIIGQKNEDVSRKINEIAKAKNYSQGAEKKAAMIEYLRDVIKRKYAQKEKEVSSQVMRQIEKGLFLRTIDSFWMDHLEQIDHMREGIGLRGYGQRDPLVEYKKEAYMLFQNLLSNINHTMTTALFKIQLAPAFSEHQTLPVANENLSYSGGEISNQFDGDGDGPATKKEQKKLTPIVNSDNIGRNDPCPCGSGKKYKKCHGA